MIRVLQIGLSYEYGGIESFVMNYYRNIDKKFIQFDFINPYSEPLAYEKEIISLGGNIFRIADFHRYPGKYRKELKVVMNNYSIVHVHMLSASNLLPLFIAKKLKIPKIIAHSHNTEAEGLLRKVIHFINYRRVKNIVTNCLACSEKAGQWMFGDGVSFAVMKNAIDCDLYEYDELKRKEYRAAFNINDDTIVYGNIGRLNVQKNQLFLLEVFAKILKKKPNSKLVIVGEGELHSIIIKKANTLGVSDSLLMLGRRDDVRYIYSMLDAILMPSLFEGLPITLVEAQANGLTCIVSETGVPKETSILDTMLFLELKSGASQWANTIINLDLKRVNKAVEMLTSRKYNIKKEAIVLQDLYLS